MFILIKIRKVSHVTEINNPISQELFCKDFIKQLQTITLHTAVMWSVRDISEAS